MNLSERISNIIVLRSQELYFLLLFVRDFDTYIHRHRTPSQLEIFQDIPDNIKTEFVEYIGELAKFMVEFITEVQGPPPAKGRIKREFKPQKDYPEEVEKYLIPFLIAFYKPIRYSRFLYDMAVTHTIALLESFLSDFLATVFTLRPNTLKSGNTATYEDILSFSSKKELIRHLASNRAEKILEGDLYEVADKLNKTFSIDISKFDKFNIIHEAFCRRHIIVHNDGITDKEYCRKIPNSKKGEQLSTDLKYIETLFTTIGQFIDYLDGCFSRKMRYRRNQLANQLLNPPDSVGESKDSS